ncbi:hypothetical protein [Mucilaginibacter sp. 44-25]|uniref:hypothetical protein n=1 Tax=Mucilaginibacter sp. 44-25 TaxID=1895794 RepID=UPI000B016CA7|nr:hypothetical protein [Mucilaginibacter sp. 44-25]HEK21613.1 hypothetical protein [Bacteroidota bacterium]
MTFTRSQIVSIILFNLAIFTFCIYNAFGWYSISAVKFTTLALCSLVFLGFVIVVLKKHYRLIFGAGNKAA